MKDIDFDELDRAVNSLMSATPGAAPQKGASSMTPASDDGGSSQPVADNQGTVEPVTPQASGTTNVLDLDNATVSREDDLLTTMQPDNNGVVVDVAVDSSVVDSAPVAADEPVATAASSGPVDVITNAEPVTEATPVVAPEPETAPVEEPTPAPVAAPVESRGRFMDLVRPGGRDTSRPAPSRVSRQGVSLQPMTPETEVEDTATAAELTRTETTVEPTVPEVADISYQEPSPEVAPDPLPTLDTTVPEITDDTAPLSSPFLPDAKVEKRPLGRASETAAPAVDLAAELAGETATPAVEESTASDNSISPNKDAQIPEQPLPAEYDSELLSIETSTEHLPAEAPATSATPTVAQPEEPKPTQDFNRSASAASIPQQYKVQPAAPASEAPAGTIYDSQPLAHPADKKLSWVWKVAAIIAIILVGAGGGAAIYYLGIL